MDIEFNNETAVIDAIIGFYNADQSLLSYWNAEILQQLTNSDSEEIRLWLAKALVNDSPSAFSEQLLCKLSQDYDSLVRTEAIDSLSAYVSQKSFEVLCSAINDCDELVRSYAAMGVAIVGREIAHSAASAVIQKLILSEHSDHVLVSAYEGLYLLGEKDKLMNIFCLFRSDDYYIQCAVLNALEDILNYGYDEHVRKFILGLNPHNYPCAVSEIINHIIDRLNSTD